jgi:hypothetical protein
MLFARIGAMENNQVKLNAAIDEWIEAYGGYQKFLAATEALYVLFADNWLGPRRGLADAFAAFRESLINECHDEHLEVTGVCPNRNPRTK